MSRKKHIDLLKNFKQRLSQKIKVNKLVLFGSRVSGRPTRYSDFDLIVVSPNFRKVDSLKRSKLFYSEWTMDYPVDFICYTPEEFNKLKKDITIVSQALKKGIEI